MIDIIKIIINGNNFSSLAEFYNEIDKVLTNNLDWQTGHNLNAFNDILRGGFGVHEYDEDIIIEWINSEKSKQDFGYKETILYYEKTLLTCLPTNKKHMKKCLIDARKNQGNTIFEIITEIINEHSNVQLIMK